MNLQPPQPYGNVVLPDTPDVQMRRTQSPAPSHPLHPKNSRTQASISPERLANFRVRHSTNPPVFQTQLSTGSMTSETVPNLFALDPSPTTSTSSGMSWTNQNLASSFQLAETNKTHQADSGIFSDDNEHSMNTKLANALELLGPRPK